MPVACATDAGVDTVITGYRIGSVLLHMVSLTSNGVTMRAPNAVVVVFLGLLATLQATWAQDSVDAARLAQAEAQLLTYWWVKVEGERGQRILRITRVGLRGDGNFGLDLNYGILGSWQGPLKGALIRLGTTPVPDPKEWIGGKTYKLEFITGAGTVITAESASAGNFVGTFAPPTGRSKPLTLERVSEEEVHKRGAGAEDARRQAAAKWLAKDEIKIDYEGAWRWTVPVDMKARTATFYYPANDYCTSAPVPAEVRVDGHGMLVFVFDPKLPGCAQVQYTFDPVLRGGFIRRRPAGSPPDAPWSGPSGAKISLMD
jgi:hypothetical protein